MVYYFQFSSGSDVDIYRSKVYRFDNRTEVLFYNGYHGQKCANHLKESFTLAHRDYGIWNPNTFWSRLV